MARGACYGELLIRTFGELRNGPPVKDGYARLLIRTYAARAGGEGLLAEVPAAVPEGPRWWQERSTALGRALGRLPAEVWLVVMGAFYLGMAVALAVLERKAGLP